MKLLMFLTACCSLNNLGAINAVPNYKFNKIYKPSIKNINITNLDQINNNSLLIGNSDNQVMLLTKNNLNWTAKTILNITYSTPVINDIYSLNKGKIILVATELGLYEGVLKNSVYSFKTISDFNESNIVSGTYSSNNTLYLLSIGGGGTVINKVTVNNNVINFNLVVNNNIFNNVTDFIVNNDASKITFLKNQQVYVAQKNTTGFTFNSIYSIPNLVSHLSFANNGNSVVYSTNTFNIYASNNLLSNDRKFQSISLSDEVTSISPTYSQDQTWFTTNNKLYDLTYANSKFSIANQPKYTDIPNNNLTYINNDSSNYNLYLVSDNSLYYGYLTNPPAPPKPPAKSSNTPTGLILGLTLGIGSFVVGGISVWWWWSRKHDTLGKGAKKYK